MICGRLLNGPRPLVDGRILIAIGVAIFVWSMWRLGHLTTQAGEPDARFALLFRGLGLGFLFVRFQKSETEVQLASTTRESLP